jgi:trk system potassium uptake protein TrkH
MFMSLDPGVRPLLQPARPVVVLRWLGQLSLALVGLLAVPALLAWATGDHDLALALALYGVVPAAVLSALVRLPARPGPLRTNEALTLAALTFIIAAGLMTMPMTTAGLTLPDAWFEAVSGVTTTGLSMLSDPSGQSTALLFTRAWMQWFGGLGIVVLSLTLAFGRSGDLRRLADPAGKETTLESSIRLHARRLLWVYLILTAGGLALVMVAGMSWPMAPIHTLAAVSTGGFGAFGDSLAGVGRGVQAALLAVAVAGALPLPLYYRAWLHGPRQLLDDPELRALLAAIVIVALLLWLLGGLLPVDAALQAATAQTTTGFATVDIAALPAGSKLVLILSMVSGAGLGSTGGGVKLLRLIILIRLIQLTLLRAQMPPHGVADLRIGGRSLESVQIEHALAVFLLFVGLVLACWLPFVVAGHAPLDALFEVVSAAATVGLSTGITGPDLAPHLKALLTLAMLAGRVEVIALLVLMYPRTWLPR